MSPELSISTTTAGSDRVVVQLGGSLDLIGAPRLKRTLESLDPSTEVVVIDLGGISFIDSTGISVLIGFQRRLTPPRSLRLTNVKRQVETLLRVTGLDDAFELEAASDSTLTPTAGDVPAEPGSGTSSAADRPQPAEGPHRPRPDHVSGLSQDAAIVVGIVATAMPFASSPEEQAERWLRTLCRHGDAGFLLEAVGIGDATFPSPAAGGHPGQAPALPEGADPVAVVIDRAREIARSRGSDSASTTDLLDAVRVVYAGVFADVLLRHTGDREHALEQLDHLLASR